MNWIVGNLQNALDTWNGKLSEIYMLVTQSPADFKGGAIWNIILNINGLNLPIERHRWAGWIKKKKQNPYICCL